MDRNSGAAAGNNPYPPRIVNQRVNNRGPPPGSRRVRAYVNGSRGGGRSNASSSSRMDYSNARATIPQRNPLDNNANPMENCVENFLTNGSVEVENVPIDRPVDELKLTKKQRKYIKWKVTTFFKYYQKDQQAGFTSYQDTLPLSFEDIEVPSPRGSISSDPPSEPSLPEAPVPKPRTSLLSQPVKTSVVPVAPIPKPRSMPSIKYGSGAKSIFQLMEESSRNKRIAVMMKAQRQNLPIFCVKEQLMEKIKEHNVIIVVGEPGSGVTTQLPQLFIKAGYEKQGRIGVILTNCAAAKTMAEKVSCEAGQRTCSTLQGAGRPDGKINVHKVVNYMTDGIFVHKCASPTHLKEFSVIMIDQVDNRTVHTDICLALLLRETWCADSKLKIVVSLSTSAKHEQFSKYFGGAPVFWVPGSLNEQEIMYLPNDPKDRPVKYLEETIKIIKDINKEEYFPKGNILVFLSNWDEIQEMSGLLSRELGKIKRSDSQLNIVSCYGSLPFIDQVKIFEPAEGQSRKIILATDISVMTNIEGVACVIDCGYSMISCLNPVNGMSYLMKKPITKLEATLRYCWAENGSEEGVCFRVYSNKDYEKMEEAGAAPQITKCNMECVTMQLALMGVTIWEYHGEDKMRPVGLHLLDLPSKDVFIEGLAQLRHLSAVELTIDGIIITEIGKRMSAFYLEPSLARVLVESIRLGCVEDVAKIIGMLSADYQVIFSGWNENVERFFHPDGDLVTLLKMYNEWLESGKCEEWCKGLGFQQDVFQEAEQIRCHLLDIVRDITGGDFGRRGATNKNIRRCFVAGYFRQIAKLKKPSGLDYHNLANATVADDSVFLDRSSVFFDYMPSLRPLWVMYYEMVVTDKEYMKIVSVIDPEWMREYVPEHVEGLEIVGALRPEQGKGLKKSKGRKRY